MQGVRRASIVPGRPDLTGPKISTSGSGQISVMRSVGSDKRRSKLDKKQFVEMTQIYFEILN